LIPAFREHDRRLLVCATNSVRSLDSAFLRPGRFDYVIPVGPPDASARRAIWKRYLGPASDEVDLDRLVASSELLTPADIEFAARKGPSRLRTGINSPPGRADEHRGLPGGHRRHPPHLESRHLDRIRAGQ
jgi:hypothetical protein